ncbi:hypothetical protein VP01_1954g1 [Puccinia sorghi]|uniref:Uncharacterized protein n=1 Tax=Puccinia sorghi TaxID=27349 RepID=A0A0L6VC51_9BASI|nr:hypothetical protein VP01_1954g1 [Puccinia sorghi]
MAPIGIRPARMTPILFPGLAFRQSIIKMEIRNSSVLRVDPFKIRLQLQVGQTSHHTQLQLPLPLTLVPKVSQNHMPRRAQPPNSNMFRFLIGPPVMFNCLISITIYCAEKTKCKTTHQHFVSSLTSLLVADQHNTDYDHVGRIYKWDQYQPHNNELVSFPHFVNIILLSNLTKGGATIHVENPHKEVRTDAQSQCTWTNHMTWAMNMSDVESDRRKTLEISNLMILIFTLMRYMRSTGCMLIMIEFILYISIQSIPIITSSSFPEMLKHGKDPSIFDNSNIIHQKISGTSIEGAMKIAAAEGMVTRKAEAGQSKQRKVSSEL